MAEGRTVRFEAPLPPICLTPNAGRDRRTTVRDRDHYQSAVAFSIRASGLWDVTFERVELHLEAVWPRWEDAWDDDAIVAAFKCGRDVLCPLSPKVNPYGLGIVPDDNPRRVRLGGVTVRVSRTERPALWVTLTELPPLPRGATSNGTG